MSVLYLDVQPTVLDWAIQRTQFEDVSENVIETLTQWRDGIKKPTFKQLEDISKKTHIPFGYFFMQMPPKENFPLVEYRTVNSETIQHPSRNLIDTVNAMQAAQDWMEDYCRKNDFDPLPFVGRSSLDGDYKMIALDIRKELDLDIDWFKECRDAASSFLYIREHATDSGVLVMKNGVVGNNTHRKLNINEFRAFTLVNKYAPLIFINSNDSDNGRLFSLLHELAHIWLGRDSLYNEPYGSYGEVSRLEQLCNAIAAEILVPDELFKEQWYSVSGDTEEKQGILAKYFKCSRFVIVLKALNNAFIDKDTFNRLFAILKKNYQKTFKPKQGGGGDYYQTFAAKWDNRFMRALIESTKSGETLYTEAYSLTGTHGKTFDNLIHEMRGK